MSSGVVYARQTSFNGAATTVETVIFMSELHSGDPAHIQRLGAESSPIGTGR
jgi:hypothetical protein